MELTDLAEERFRQGYSCSQAVFSVLAERFNVSPELSLRIAAGFGGGLARTAGTCGSITGGVMAIGLAQRGVTPEENPAGKDQTCETSRRFMRAFAEQNGSVVCADLLGCNIGTPEGHEEARQKGLFRSLCPKLVRDAVEIADGLLPR